MANYTNNLFGQLVAILRDVRLAFWDAGDFGGSNAKAEGREIHNSNTLAHFCPQEAYRETGMWDKPSGSF